MAKELLALRKAFSVPVYWEIAGHIFATEEEALSYGFIESRYTASQRNK